MIATVGNESCSMWRGALQFSRLRRWILGRCTSLRLATSRQRRPYLVSQTTSKFISYVSRMRSNAKCIIKENSRISDLSCFQRTVGERNVSCAWHAEPPGAFFEILFTKPNGNELFRKNVSENLIFVEFDDAAGNAIEITVRNVSTKIELIGKLIEINAHCGQQFRRFVPVGSWSCVGVHFLNLIHLTRNHVVTIFMTVRPSPLCR